MEWGVVWKGMYDGVVLCSVQYITQSMKLDTHETNIILLYSSSRKPGWDEAPDSIIAGRL